MGVPKETMFWAVKDSLSALEAIEKFYRYLFVEISNLKTEEIQEILVSRVEIQNIGLQVMYEEFKAEFSAAKQYGVDFDFMGLC